MKFIFPIGLNIWNSKLKMIWTICWERQTTKCNNAWNKKRLINELMKCIWFTKENRKNDNSEYDSLRLPIKKITSTITKYIDSGILQHAFSKRALIVNSNTKNSFFFSIFLECSVSTKILYENWIPTETFRWVTVYWM